MIELPAQTLSSDMAIEGVRWLIGSMQPGAERQLAEFSLSPYLSEAGWETEAYQFALPRPGNYSVTLEITNGKEYRPLRSWYFRCASSELNPSLLAFDGESGELLAARDTLPARTLWLLIPRQRQLQVFGGSKREEVAQFTGSWASFKAEAWDLGSATSVKLDKLEFLIEPDLALFLPYLQGQEIAEVEPQPGQPRIFTGQLPDLFIPLPPQRDPEIEAERWRIAVTVLYTGTRQQLLVSSLAEMQYHSINKEDLTQLHLALYEQPALKSIQQGRFEIALRGPLGRDMTFHVALVPGLQIQIHEQDRVRVPEHGKAPALTFMLTTSVESQLESMVPGIQVQVAAEPRYRIQVSGECSRADLLLKCERVRQIEAKALKKLNVPGVRGFLRDYADPSSTDKNSEPEAPAKKQLIHVKGK